jgi:DNA topoisomerase I
MENLTKKAGLRYVNDSEPGFHRKPWGRGFTYLDEDGEHITDQETRERLEGLVIPPAWTDVWICSSPDGHIQATGRDEKGRKQYIYHPAWGEVRDQVKFNRLLDFGEALPQLRGQVSNDLRRHTLSREVVTALVVRLLDKTLMRIGNEVYVEENGSYGLTTLQDDHTDINGTLVSFSFPGKSGKRQEVALRDKRLAQLVQRCQDLPGQHLFQYVGEDGALRSITSTDVNQYVQEHTGRDFTAKLFRTWGATVAAAEDLAAVNVPETEAMAKKFTVQAIKCAADLLGNTPTVCRQYYVHPAVIEHYQEGNLAQVVQDVASGKIKVRKGLSEIETAVLHLLQSDDVA